MKEELLRIITENLNTIVGSAVTILIAWMKKKYDIRNLKKSGRLIEASEVIEKTEKSKNVE